MLEYGLIFVAGAMFGAFVMALVIAPVLYINTKKDETITELIDKFVHNKVPERIVTERQQTETTTKPRPTLDPVSAAEALAREAAEE